jgi:predicted enzyme related to lactoylglutathione lyase
VSDLDEAIEAFVSKGGEVLAGPDPAPGGRRAHVQDRDGNLFECFQAE